jgi:hypothetical protein
MAGFNKIGRRVSLSNDSNAAARRKGKPAGSSRAAAFPVHASGLELLESRVLMSAVRLDAGFNTSLLIAGDDRSFPTTGTAGVSLGFTAPINFFGNVYSGVFVNNNGNISLGARNSVYSNADIGTVPSRMIAPFYANVDTRFAGSTVKYGTSTINGNRAFGVNWLDVDYFPSSTGHVNRNSFQLVMIDLGGGNFDMEFNYDRIAWESSSNSGGDANGLGGSSARIGWNPSPAASSTAT